MSVRYRESQTLLSPSCFPGSSAVKSTACSKPPPSYLFWLRSQAASCPRASCRAVLGPCCCFQGCLSGPVLSPRRDSSTVGPGPSLPHPLATKPRHVPSPLLPTVPLPARTLPVSWRASGLRAWGCGTSGKDEVC